MQFTSIISAIALAMTVSAAPAPWNSPPPSNSCSSSQSLCCCGQQWGSLNAACVTVAALPLLDATCSASSSYQCCPNDSVNQNGLVNVGVNCVAVPVTV